MKIYLANKLIQIFQGLKNNDNDSSNNKNEYNQKGSLDDVKSPYIQKILKV